MRWRRGAWAESLINQGASDLPDALKKRVRLTNIGALFGAIVMATTTPFDVMEVGRAWMVVLDVIATLFFMGVILINRRGHVTASRITLLIAGNLLAFANVIGVGRESGVGFLFLGLMAVPFALFDLRERVPLVLGLGLTFAGLVTSALDLLPQLSHAGVPASVRVYHVYSMGVAVILILFTLFQITSENARAERTLRLDIAARERAERELAESRQSAISAAKMAALGEMSASVAHEVNNPLAAILLRAQRLEALARSEKLDAATVLRTARDVSRTVERIRRIVDALRAFARRGDEDPLRPELLEPIIRDTVELCEHRFRSRGIKLTVDPIPEGLLILGRGTQVSQVLLNLLSNAYDAVERQEQRWVRITVEENGHEVGIAVTDSGPGVPEEIAPRIMEPFYTTKETGRGTGLGLSLSKGIAEAHGGRLELDRRAPLTRFVFTLKHAAAPEPEVG